MLNGVLGGEFLGRRFPGCRLRAGDREERGEMENEEADSKERKVNYGRMKPDKKIEKKKKRM